MERTSRPGIKGLRQFLDPEQQRAWMEDGIRPPDAVEREEVLEHRFRYAARFEKLLRRPQADDVLALLGRYGATCLPIPRTTERTYWSVSCLPSTSANLLARVNASWMELFTLAADGDGVRARFILHLSDFTADGSVMPEAVDQAFLESCIPAPEDVRPFFPNGVDIFGLHVRSDASIRQFLANDRALRAIRRFNLTHMNRGRNAYQASHCYSLADHMLGE